MVSDGTRDLTLVEPRALLAETRVRHLKAVTADDTSADGPSGTITQKFPQLDSIGSDINLGLTRANVGVAENARKSRIMLLNPGTEIRNVASDSLLAFASERTAAGTYCGCTVFPHDALNCASDRMRIILWQGLWFLAGIRNCALGILAELNTDGPKMPPLGKKSGIRNMIGSKATDMVMDWFLNECAGDAGRGAASGRPDRPRE